MIPTIAQAAASAAIIVVAFAICIALIEEWRMWHEQREVDRIRAQVAINAAKRRHPSTRDIRGDEAQIMRGEIEVAKARQSYEADELQP